MNTTLSVVVYGLAASLLALGADSANNMFRDYSYWGEYQSVKFVETDDNKLVFESKSVIKKPVKLTWNDILECKVNRQRFAMYSTNIITSKNYVKPADNSRKGVLWVYHGKTPKAGICRLRAEITYTKFTKFAIWQIPFSKTQVIYSKPFTLGSNT